MKAWAGRFLAASGAPDLLINNAALINRNAPTWEVPAEEFDRLIDVNIKGVANVLRREGRPLPESVGVGRVRRPVPAGARAGGQRQAAHRAGAVSRHLATEFPG